LILERLAFHSTVLKLRFVIIYWS